MGGSFSSKVDQGLSEDVFDLSNLVDGLHEHLGRELLPVGHDDVALLQGHDLALVADLLARLLDPTVEEQALPVVVPDDAFPLAPAEEDARLDYLFVAVGLDGEDDPLLPLGVEVAEGQGRHQRGRFLRVEHATESLVDLLGVDSLNLVDERSVAVL